MKYILILICLLELSVTLSAQTVSEKDLFKYEEVYNYLNSDSTMSGRRFVVSDTLVFMEKSLFWKFFQRSDESAVECLNRVEDMDRREQYVSVYSEELSSRFGLANDKVNLYFSKILENILFAEYYYHYGLGENGLYQSDKFNAGCRYLFVFDGDSQIQNVLKQDIAYR